MLTLPDLLFFLRTNIRKGTFSISSIFQKVSRHPKSLEKNHKRLYVWNLQKCPDFLLKVRKATLVASVISLTLPYSLIDNDLIRE
jgi:hypothetical protein